MGEADIEFFNVMEVEEVVRPSSWTSFPSETDPFAMYKFIGLEIYFNSDHL